MILAPLAVVGLAKAAGDESVGSGVADSLGDGEADGDGLADAEGDAEGDALGEADGEGEAEALGLALGLLVADALGEVTEAPSTAEPLLGAFDPVEVADCEAPW